MQPISHLPQRENNNPKKRSVVNFEEAIFLCLYIEAFDKDTHINGVTSNYT